LKPSDKRVKKDIKDYIKKKHGGDLCTAFDVNSDEKLDTNELDTALDKIADKQNGFFDDWGNWSGLAADKILD
jgi:hypothetical protein